MTRSQAHKLYKKSVESLIPKRFPVTLASLEEKRDEVISSANRWIEAHKRFNASQSEDRIRYYTRILSLLENQLTNLSDDELREVFSLTDLQYIVR